MELLHKRSSDKILFVVADPVEIDFKEAIIFAFLGLKFVLGLRNCKHGIGGNLAKGSSHKLSQS